MGAAGRMGVELQASVLDDSELTATALVERAGSPVLGTRGISDALPAYTADLVAAVGSGDVVVDFTTQTFFQSALQAAVSSRVAFVSGTTGLHSVDVSSLEQAATEIPVLYSPNMSVGIQVMVNLLEQAARALGPAYDIEMTETHHNKKIDAPSGTAKRLAAALSAVIGAGKDVPVHSIRGGDVVGDHTVHFMGPGDRIEITHRATTRRTFAAGALRAAKWLMGKPPGLYGMNDVL